MFDWQSVVQSFPELLKASVVTVELVLLSCAFGLVLGVALGLLRSSKNPLIYGLPFLYIFFFRGTPLLIQMSLIYFGLGQLDLFKHTLQDYPIFKDPFWYAVVALTLNTAAYIAEIVRGSISSIPKGELEAADAIGMSPSQKIKRIILPRAFGIMIPAYSNEVIFILKGSALAASIVLAELTYQAKVLAAKNWQPLEMYFAAGVIYLLLSWVILFGFRLFERRVNKHKYSTAH